MASLDLSDMKSVIDKKKGKGVNLPKSVIDEAISDLEKSDKIAGEKLRVSSSLKEFSKNLKDNHFSNKAEYEKKIEDLEKKIKFLHTSFDKLSKNEEKLLSAIKSERLLQSIDQPIIGRTKLIKEYSMNSKYLDDAIRGLISKNLIERKSVSYTANIKTYSWKLL